MLNKYQCINTTLPFCAASQNASNLLESVNKIETKKNNSAIYTLGNLRIYLPQSQAASCFITTYSWYIGIYSNI